ncbi:MAG: hypothetical protein JST31_09190 [Actinobacteria bacterium]|nr:hypothetical protein [Actinomycetota bacterium]
MKGRNAAAIIAATSAMVIVVALTGTALADVGIERVSRHAGPAGEEVQLTLACGFCFPPCAGPKGERHPEGFEKGPCIPGTERRPPASFGVSLVSKRRAERLAACQLDGRSCPTPPRPPRGHGYRFLGAAVPPPGGNDPEHGDLPRYLLSFRIPPLAAGSYGYVIWCGACLRGRAGSLITYPASPLWQLRIRPAPPSGGVD